MRRRQPVVAPEVPQRLQEFHIGDWYDPPADPLPARWTPYGSAEDRFAHHSFHAYRRWWAARQEAGI